MKRKHIYNWQKISKSFVPNSTPKKDDKSLESSMLLELRMNIFMLSSLQQYIMVGEFVSIKRQKALKCKFVLRLNVHICMFVSFPYFNSNTNMNFKTILNVAFISFILLSFAILYNFCCEYFFLSFVIVNEFHLYVSFLRNFHYNGKYSLKSTFVYYCFRLLLLLTFLVGFILLPFKKRKKKEFQNKNAEFHEFFKSFRTIVKSFCFGKETLSRNIVF